MVNLVIIKEEMIFSFSYDFSYISANNCALWLTLEIYTCIISIVC